MAAELSAAGATGVGALDAAVDPAAAMGGAGAAHAAAGAGAHAGIPPSDAILFPLVCFSVGIFTRLCLKWTRVPYTAMLLVRRRRRRGLRTRRAGHAAPASGPQRRCCLPTLPHARSSSHPYHHPPKTTRTHS